MVRNPVPRKTRRTALFLATRHAAQHHRNYMIADAATTHGRRLKWQPAPSLATQEGPMIVRVRFRYDLPPDRGRRFEAAALTG